MAPSGFANHFVSSEGLSASSPAGEGGDLIQPDDAVIADGGQVAAGGIEDERQNPGRACHLHQP